MKTTIAVDNIKCGGCRNSIHKRLGEMVGVFGVEIDMERGEVTLDHTDEVDRAQIESHLTQMGYPPKGSLEGLGSVKATLKSYVSCAIGRLTEEKK